MWNRLSALPMKTQTKAWLQRGQQEFGASMCGLSYIQAVNIRAITDPGYTLATRGGRGIPMAARPPAWARSSWWSARPGQPGRHHIDPLTTVRGKVVLCQEVMGARTRGDRASDRAIVWSSTTAAVRELPSGHYPLNRENQAQSGKCAMCPPGWSTESSDPSRAYRPG
jgi:hypothetical protein